MALGYKRRKTEIHAVEHRLIMEKHINRKLSKQEVVHHINGNKRDNRIENLLLCKDRKEHNKIHSTEFCPSGHKFTPENTAIRYNTNGNPRRRCKECDKIRERTYYHNVVKKSLKSQAGNS